jgi:voltage-gated potassium channel
MSIFFRLGDLPKRRLLFAAVTVAVVIALGTIGFHLIENLDWLDSLYTSTQTVTTVGYGDIAPQSRAGRFIAVVLMLMGVGTVLYALTVLAQSVIQSELVETLGRRRRIREMEKLEGHYIVCGAGRVGRRIIKHLNKQNLPCVVIERDDQKVTNLDGKWLRVVIGDATSEQNLIDAGVKRARGLASCLADDAANVYVVLTARGLNPDLHIVARAVEEQAEPTLVRAGASRVVAPTIIGSQSMARSLLRPAIADFMESIVAETLDLVFEEIAVDKASPYHAKLLRDTGLSDAGVIVVAIRRKDGEFTFQPTAETLIEDGDLLFVIGKAEAVRSLIQ